MKCRTFLLTIVLFITHLVNGQYNSVKGDFSVDQQTGCYALTVTITTINSGSGGTVIYQFNGNSSPPTTNPIHTYTSPGIYQINHFIQGNTGEKKDSILITVLSPELPSITLVSCTNFEVLVQINDSYYDMYEIDYGDGTTILANNSLVSTHTYANNATYTISVTGLFATSINRCGTTSIPYTPVSTPIPAQINLITTINNSILKLNYQLSKHSKNRLEYSKNNTTSYRTYKELSQNTSSEVITNLELSKDVYCFRIATYDTCNNSLITYSNEACSIHLNLTAENNQIILDWSTISTEVIDLYRDGVVQKSLALPISQYIDSTTICNTTYCYKAAVEYKDGGISQSLTMCTTSFSTDIPESVANISSETNSNFILWTWEIPSTIAVSYYTVHLFNEKGDLLKSDSVSSNFYQIPIESTLKHIAVEVHSICNNTSEISNLSSNILLEVEGSSDQLHNIKLKWNSYTGWAEEIKEYYITVKDSKGTLTDSISTHKLTSFIYSLDNQSSQTLIFTVWAIPNTNGIPHSQSNILIFHSSPIISIPTSFTPNGDNLNDIFFITGKFIASYKLQIFNRWGEILFQTTDLKNGWDGKSNNKKMPVGNYIYKARIKDFNNTEYVRTGSIFILSN